MKRISSELASDGGEQIGGLRSSSELVSVGAVVVRLKVARVRKTLHQHWKISHASLSVGRAVAVAVRSSVARASETLHSAKNQRFFLGRVR